MHAALHGRGDSSRFVVLDGSAGRTAVEGLVRRKGLHDELTGELFAVVETVEGRAFYVRLDSASAERVREGSLVRVEASAEPWAKRIDQAIAAAAREAGGIYDPIVHLRQLEARRPSIGGAMVDPAEVVAANVRRLKRLARYQIVARGVGDTWKVPANLLAILAAREKTHPRVRTTVEVVSTRPLEDARALRPAWLDGQAIEDPTRAGYGFGAEVSAAVRGRAAFLRGHGIDASGPDRKRALERRAALAVAEEVAATIGGTVLQEAPAGFRGRLQVREPVDGGPSVALVVDEGRRAVVVVGVADAPPDLRGQVVEIARDTAGRPVARRAGLNRGE
jgi:hypothetical protein